MTPLQKAPVRRSKGMDWKRIWAPLLILLKLIPKHRPMAWIQKLFGRRLCDMVVCIVNLNRDHDTYFFSKILQFNYNSQ